MTATAESYFAVADGKLIISDVDSEVVFGKKNIDTSQQDTSPLRANIRMDISLIK